MNNEQLVTFIFLLGALAVTVFFINVHHDSDSSDPPDEENNHEESQIYCGVDSASSADDELNTCVQDNFGESEIWGRYIGEKEGVSEGLNKEEVDFLHNKVIHILIIYNHFTDATGFENGVAEAE